VIAAANPLRGLAADAADVVRTVDGPVVLAAHSYGGAVISKIGEEDRNIPDAISISHPDATAHQILDAAAMQ
jgi:predicted alpha/beta hydrolase family esterase